MPVLMTKTDAALTEIKATATNGIDLPAAPQLVVPHSQVRPPHLQLRQR